MLNRKKLVSALFAAGLMVTGAASAQTLQDESNLYWGIGLGEGDMDISSNGLEGEERMPGFAVHMGYEISPYISFEGRLVRQKNDYTASMANGYVRFSAPTARTSTYLMLGGGVTEVYTSNGTGDVLFVDCEDGSISNTSSGGSLENGPIGPGNRVTDEDLCFSKPELAGVLGVELFGNDETALTLEYMANFSSDDNYRIEMFTLGFRHYFGGYQR
ncbi:MAG: outer membrane beta-barrel protein [Pseudomonadota bacterium]